MVSKRQRETMSEAALDGDSLASAQLRDIAQDEPLVYGSFRQMPVPKKDDWLIIYTAAHYYCGQLLGEDHEYYCLAEGAVVVYETGELSKFYGEGVATHCEALPTVHWVRKGPTVALGLWPHNRPARRANP